MSINAHRGILLLQTLKDLLYGTCEITPTFTIALVYLLCICILRETLFTLSWGSIVSKAWLQKQRFSSWRKGKCLHSSANTGFFCLSLSVVFFYPLSVQWAPRWPCVLAETSTSTPRSLTPVWICCLWLVAWGSTPCTPSCYTQQISCISTKPLVGRTIISALFTFATVLRTLRNFSLRCVCITLEYLCEEFYLF